MEVCLAIIYLILLILFLGVPIAVAGSLVWCFASWLSKRRYWKPFLWIVVSIFSLFGGYFATKFGIKKHKEVAAWRDARLEESRRQEEENRRQEEEARLAEERRREEAARLAEERRRQNERDEKIKAFALNEASEVWSAYQALESEIEVQKGKIGELRDTLVKFGKDPEEDEDFKRICDLRDDMIRSHAVLRGKLEDAYIAWRKYESAPSRKDYQELHMKSIEDGVREAEAASAKFKEMRLNK